jgi:hypothetical protein
MEQFYITVLFKIIYIAKRHVAFCLITESYFIKVLVALLRQMDVSMKFDPVMEGHVGLLTHSLPKLTIVHLIIND